MDNLENKNLLLHNYKDLIVQYEDFRQVANELIYPNEDPILTCSSICVKNASKTVTKWQLLSIDRTVLYTSSRHAVSSITTIYPSYVEIEPGTLFKLKAVVKWGDDSIADITLECGPIPGVTAYFELTGTAFITQLKFKGTTNPW